MAKKLLSPDEDVLRSFEKTLINLPVVGFSIVELQIKKDYWNYKCFSFFMKILEVYSSIFELAYKKYNDRYWDLFKDDIRRNHVISEMSTIIYDKIDDNLFEGEGPKINLSLHKGKNDRRLKEFKSDKLVIFDVDYISEDICDIFYPFELSMDSFSNRLESKDPRRARLKRWAVSIYRMNDSSDQKMSISDCINLLIDDDKTWYDTDSLKKEVSIYAKRVEKTQMQKEIYHARFRRELEAFVDSWNKSIII